MELHNYLYVKGKTKNNKYGIKNVKGMLLYTLKKKINL